MTRLRHLALGLILVSAAHAQEAPPPPPAPNAGQHHQGPPPEAFQACTGKSDGSRSEFKAPDGVLIKGVCKDDGHGKIVLRPDHPPGGKRRGPPPEAYAACNGKTAGAKAQFVSPKGDTISGTCESEDGKLVLRPDHPPEPPPAAKPPAQ